MVTDAPSFVVSGSRVHPDDSLIVRNPVAWVCHPILILSRQEDGERAQAIIVDAPGVPKYRVHYASARRILKLIRGNAHDMPEQLEAFYRIDYRTWEHMLQDGWRVV